MVFLDCILFRFQTINRTILNVSQTFPNCATLGNTHFCRSTAVFFMLDSRVVNNATLKTDIEYKSFQSWV